MGRRSGRDGLRLPLMVGVAALACAGPATADIASGDGEIGFDYGLTRFSEDLGDDTGTRFGLHVGRSTSSFTEWEVQLATATARREPLPGAAQETRFSQLMLNLLVNFHPHEGIEPFVLVGTGLTRFRLEQLGIGTDDTGTAVALGGGSRFFFGRKSRAAFRIEFTLVESKSFKKNFAIPGMAFGLTWRLGRRP